MANFGKISSVVAARHAVLLVAVMLLAWCRPLIYVPYVMLCCLLCRMAICIEKMGIP